MGYPTVQDLTDALTALGYSVDSVQSQLPKWLAAAIGRFERESGWVPFLAGQSATYTYDLPEWGQEIDFRTGFVEITEVASGVDEINNPTGNVLELNNHYTLLTLTGVAEVLPYTRLRFLSSMARLVRVTGKRGRVLEMDGEDPSKAADAFEAILHDAATRGEDVLQDKSGQIKSVTSGAVKYDLQVSKDERRSKWDSQWNEAVMTYLRPVVGF